MKLTKSRGITAAVGLIFTLFLLLIALCGCGSINPASVPSNMPTPFVVNKETAAVLKNATDKGSRVLASGLESQAESGSVILVDHAGWVYNPDGTVFVDKEGNPIKVTTTVIAKLNSLQEMASLTTVKSVEYIVGGFEYMSELPDSQKDNDMCPEALRLKIEGIGELKATPTIPGAREAAAKERAAILQGLTTLAEARGVALASEIKAVGDGVVDILTATGTHIIGKLNGTSLITDGAAGLASAVEAKITKDDGKEETVILSPEAAEDAEAILADTGEPTDE